MYVDKNTDIEVELEPYIQKYKNYRIDSYGIGYGNDASIEYKFNPIKNDSKVKLKHESGPLNINLYRYYDASHNKVKSIEYNITHVIYSRKSVDEAYEKLYTANIKVPFKSDINGILNSGPMSFKNLIYKMWDEYEGYVLSEDRDTKAFDELILSKNDGRNTLAILDIEHGEDINNKPNYKYDFTGTEKNDWETFKISENENINLFYKLKPELNDQYQNIEFKYYFTGDPNDIPKPEEIVTSYSVRHYEMDSEGNNRLINIERYDSAEVGTEIETKDSILISDSLIHSYTVPSDEKITLVKDESQNIITHYYYNKASYIPVRYHAEGGKFGKLENAYPGSDENTRIILAKKTDLAKDHNPGDISKPGFAFVDWTNDKEGLEPIGDELVAGLGTTTENGVEYVDIYAQWREVVDPIVTFHANGGSFGDNTSTKTFTGKGGRTIGSYVPSGLRRSGYNFIKWTQGLNGNEMV